MKPLIATLILIAFLGGSATAAEVDVQLSAREAYVGMPVALQISITNAQDYTPPTIPPIDGCDIRSAGPPSRSSQVTIINGRRSERSSDTLTYLITPRRAGSFKIPPLTMQVDGRTETTAAMQFVATKSETGDLLFVEIEGDKDRVYVGQPLDLTLKIWLKPYRDSQRDLTLSEGDMWQMISERSSWGGFTDRMQELAQSRRRPGGQEVLREDDDGHERSYYLYEIEATIYPTRAGKIDADDVQIVVQYPTALGTSRSPLGSMFDDDFFGDSLFGSSFGNRLSVTSTRPIVGEARVDATEVLPVPSEGRPSDYRGAVGQYQIVTQATPTTVDAGEPITLNIGIAGTGPMERVQAPPLHEMPELTADFKVADESLAGFVQDDTKLFSTTIRPRRAGITRIPAIRFSYFDPDTERFETVFSEPISLTVQAAETLNLDAIVGRSRSDRDGHQDDAAAPAAALPDFTNNHDPALVLVSQSPSAGYAWWWLVILPPVIWLAAVVGKYRGILSPWLPRIRSAKARCLSSLQRAEEAPAIRVSLRRYIGERSGTQCPTDEKAIGALRTAGLYNLAGEVESFFHKLARASEGSPYASSATSIDVFQARAAELVEQLDSAFTTHRRLGRWNGKRSPGRTVAKSPTYRSFGVLGPLLFSFAVGSADAAEPIALSPLQQRTVLAEAAEAYTQATNVGGTDSANAKAAFDAAAAKYQLLVDSGIHNSQLYLNLGNAYLQSGQLGRAIASYERAKRLNPHHPTLLSNLQLAQSQVNRSPENSLSIERSVEQSILQSLRSINDNLSRGLGIGWMRWILIVSSVVFWSLLTLHTLGWRFHVWRWAVLPLGLGLVSLGSLLLAESAPAPSWNAVIVADTVAVYAGDGEAFERLQTIDTAQGHRVEVIGKRGEWLQIRMTDQQLGWIADRAVSRVTE